MTNTPEQERAKTQERVDKFWADVEKRSAPHRQQAFAYEQVAIDYSKKGFETLTYLNGGALVALPAALAFFKADVPASSIVAVGLFHCRTAGGCARPSHGLFHNDETLRGVAILIT
jgi:hypothetical protein